MKYVFTITLIENLFFKNTLKEIFPSIKFLRNNYRILFNHSNFIITTVQSIISVITCNFFDVNLINLQFFDLFEVNFDKIHKKIDQFY